LQTERLRLEPLVEGHAVEMFDALRDPQIYGFIPEKPPLSIAALRQRYRMLQSGKSPDGSQLWLNWVIRIVSSDRCVGYVQATVHTSRTADFAYVLASAFWGRGIATEACAAAIDFLEAELTVRSLYATVSAENHRSMRLLARLGFVEVDAARYPHGKVAEGDRAFSLALGSRHIR
jgi:RimJ/RimL family protein N-acetyltransferase